MGNKTSEKRIPISQLLIDLQNPRLPEIQSNQVDAIRTIVQTQCEKLLTLAKHVVKHGPNPAHLPIVMPSQKDGQSYVVLEGNRRVTALKLLNSPTIAGDVLESKNLQLFKEMSAEFAKMKIQDINCFVVASRAEADTWIQLIHRGQQAGAGLVEWDGLIAARYDARRGKKRQLVALKLLDFARSHGKLSATTCQQIDDGKFPITNLQRLLNTPDVREMLGLITTRDGNVLRNYPKEEVLKGLNRIVEDLGTGAKTVSHIKSRSQRIRYISSLPKSALPKSGTVLTSAVPLDAASDQDDGSAGKNQRKRKRPIRPRMRKILIPKDCDLNVTHHRIEDIYNELKRLNVDEFSNAAAVMLRVFVELSLVHFLENTLKWQAQRVENTKLAQKLEAVAKHFENNKIMTHKELQPIRKASAGQTLLVASVKTLHAYVHNRHFSPVASELKTAWDDLQPFMENVWPV